MTKPAVDSVEKHRRELDSTDAEAVLAAVQGLAAVCSGPAGERTFNRVRGKLIDTAVVATTLSDELPIRREVAEILSRFPGKVMNSLLAEALGQDAGRAAGAIVTLGDMGRFREYQEMFSGDQRSEIRQALSRLASHQDENVRELARILLDDDAWK